MTHRIPRTENHAEMPEVKPPEEKMYYLRIFFANGEESDKIFLPNDGKEMFDYIENELMSRGRASFRVKHNHKYFDVPNRRYFLDSRNIYAIELEETE